MKKNHFAISLALIGLTVTSVSAASAADSISWAENVKNKTESPIGFMGFMTARVNNGKFFTQPNFSTAYNDRILPSGQMNLKIVANPHPMVKLSTVMTVGTNFNGIFSNEYTNRTGKTDGALFAWEKGFDGFRYSDMNRAWYVHNNEREVASIAEELIATADIRTNPFKVEVQAGSALWVENSPLTIYRRDNRHKSAWYWEAFEPEYSSQTMYSYKLLNRIDWGGQPVWPRKTFGGVSADFYELPAGFNAKFLIAEPSNIRPLEKRGNTMADWGDREALEAVSHPGWLYAVHLGNSRIPGLFDVNAAKGKNSKVQLGFNLLKVDFYDEIVNECTPSNFGPKCYANSFRNGPSYWNTPRASDIIWDFVKDSIANASLSETTDSAGNYGFLNHILWKPNSSAVLAYTERPYIVEPTVYSIDLKGNWNPKHYTQAEIALSISDTTFFTPLYNVGSYNVSLGGYVKNINGKDTVFTYNKPQYDATGKLIASPLDTTLAEDPSNQIFEKTKGGSKQDLAFYYKSYNENVTLPFMVELGYFGKDFNSPYSMTEYAVPVTADEFVVGSGTNLYHKNLVGGNILLMPRRLNGYTRIMLGQYRQLTPAQDVVRFQHNLIGRDLWKSTFSWSRFDPTMNVDQGHANNTSDRAMLRAGNQIEGLKPEGFAQNQNGGYIGDDSQMWERYAIFSGNMTEKYLDTANALNKDTDKTNDIYSTRVVDYETVKSRSEQAKSFDDLRKALDESLIDNVNNGVLKSIKATGTVSIDHGMYLSPMLGLKRTLFVNLYAEANAVDKDVAIPFVKDNMFRDLYGMTEVLVGITNNFSIIGMAGFEKMTSNATTLRNGIIGNGSQQTEDYLVRELNLNGYVNNYTGVPEINAPVTGLDDPELTRMLSLKPEYYYSKIDYDQWALGLGFDWDFSPRAGFHFRYKFVNHTDNAVDAMNAKMEQWLNANPVIKADGSVDVKAYQRKVLNSVWLAPTSYSMGHLFAETKVWF